MTNTRRFAAWILAFVVLAIPSIASAKRPARSAKDTPKAAPPVFDIAWPAWLGLEAIDPDGEARAAAEAVAAVTLSPLAIDPERETLTTFFVSNRKTFATFVLPRTGVVEKAKAKKLARLFRCRRTGRRRPIAAGLIAMITDVSATYPGHVIEVVSGVRAPPYGAPDSKHYSGHALDFRVRGVNVRKVRDQIWTTHSHIGLGYYPRQGFLHMDYRPEAHGIAWTARRPGVPYLYHPRWARRLNRQASRVGL